MSFDKQIENIFLTEDVEMLLMLEMSSAERAEAERMQEKASQLVDSEAFNRQLINAFKNNPDTLYILYQLIQNISDGATQIELGKILFALTAWTTGGKSKGIADKISDKIKDVKTAFGKDVTMDALLNSKIDNIKKGAEQAKAVINDAAKNKDADKLLELAIKNKTITKAINAETDDKKTNNILNSLVKVAQNSNDKVKSDTTKLITLLYLSKNARVSQLIGPLLDKLHGSDGKKGGFFNMIGKAIKAASLPAVDALFLDGINKLVFSKDASISKAAKEVVDNLRGKVSGGGDDKAIEDMDLKLLSILKNSNPETLKKEYLKADKEIKAAGLENNQDILGKLRRIKYNEILFKVKELLKGRAKLADIVTYLNDSKKYYNELKTEDFFVIGSEAVPQLRTDLETEMAKLRIPTSAPGYSPDMFFKK
jgi:hypothetical protein